MDKQQSNEEVISGYVDHIVFRNNDNGYTVMVMICDEEELTCVGIFSDIAEGECIEAAVVIALEFNSYALCATIMLTISSATCTFDPSRRL